MVVNEFDDLRESVDGFRNSVLRYIKYARGKRIRDASKRDFFVAVALTVRDRLIDRSFNTEDRYRTTAAKQLFYLSMEYLIGRSLKNNLLNLGIYDLCREALAQLDVDLVEIEEHENDAALGNGGLGRLAACFLDSMATYALPGYGYGINYEYGLFRQDIDQGYQREMPDHWRSTGNPWLIERADEACIVPIYGKIEHTEDRDGNYNPMWLDWRVLIGVPHDMLVPGSGGRSVNRLRLFSAQSSEEFDIKIFNEGDYVKAVEQKITSETLSKVLYPSDVMAAGKELRLLQEYFLVSCSIRDIVSGVVDHLDSMEDVATRVAIQMNDTHPALAVAELMRVLVDEYDLPWERAWAATQATLGYTNHTLLPEALETWPVPLFEHVLPRHLQIVFEINHRFLDDVACIWPDDVERLQRMSLIQEGETKQLRMAHLAIVGSHAVNGVAQLHTELLRSSLFPDFSQLWPRKFSNKTNGVTQRRWLRQANPGLSELLCRRLDESWIKNLYALEELESYADDEEFQSAFRETKRSNKEALADLVHGLVRTSLDPTSVFDVQVKRIHEYKRQTLNILHIIHQYLCVTEDRIDMPVAKTYIFAGKAAPGYFAAKLIIKLVNCVGKIINEDSRLDDQLKVVFIPDYRVSLAEKIIPASDISEQISTAGMEASGTGNMKMAINGALTIGTRDGANIELEEAVGAENMFLFGHSAQDILAMRADGSYNPWDYYDRNPHIKRIIDAIGSDLFCPEEPGLFRPIYEALLNGGDYYFNLADLESYIEVQERSLRAFQAPEAWTRMSILNIARSGRFSSDRTISEYAREIWDIKAVP